MIKRIRAIFDGNVLRPSEPLDLPPNTEVQLTLDVPQSNGNGSASFLDTAQSLNLDGPADWSTNVDNYLYGSQDNQDG